MIRTVLEACGADVDDADSAAQGPQEAAAWRPSIIVCDIGTPHQGGYEFIQNFRESERESGTRTPLVALTAYDSRISAKNAE